MEKNTIRELLGRQVKNLRKGKNLTKEELAAKCELHLDLIEAIEKGKEIPLWGIWQKYREYSGSSCLTCSRRSKKKDFHL